MKQKRIIALSLVFMFLINFIPFSKVYAAGEDTLKVGVYTQDGVIYQSVDVEFVQGDTAYSALARVVGDIKTKGSGTSIYVSSIAGVAEFDQGPLSGWVYAVNGVKPDASAGACYLNPGDKLVWHYTLDLGGDIYNGINKLDSYIAANPPVPPAPPEVEKPTPPTEEKPTTKPEQEKPSTEPSKPSESGGGSNPSKPSEGVSSNSSEDSNKSENDKEVTEKDKNADERNEDSKANEGLNTLSKEELNKSIDSILASSKEAFKKNLNSTWEAMALKKLGGEVSKEYVNSIINEIKENKGIYSKVTDLEKNILFLNMLGYDITNIEGINLIEVLLTSDVEKQGANGVIFAIICLNSIDSQVLEKFFESNSEKAGMYTKEDLIEKLLSYQQENGGFPLVKDKEADVDITAMALQALGGFRDRVSKDTLDSDKLDEVILKATDYLKKAKFENSESIAQTIIACSYVKENPQDFGGVNLIEELLKYKQEDNTFKHIMDSDSDDDRMATEQGILALLSYKGQEEDKDYIYAGEVQGEQVQVAVEKAKNNNALIYITIAAIVILGSVAGFLVYKKSKKNHKEY